MRKEFEVTFFGTSRDGSHPQPMETALLTGAAESIWAGSMVAVTIQLEVSDRLKEAMEQQGLRPLESVFITDSDIRHIMRRHTLREKERGQLSIAPNDFASLPAVLNDFDTCEHTDTDKLGNKKFLLTKRVGDVYYVVTIQRGKRKLQVKTMWKRPGASC
jgi:hypothetical protein